MANRDKSFGINVLAVAKGLEQVGRGVEKLGRTLDEFDRKVAKATVDVDTKAADAKIGKFARDLQSKVERAVRSLPDIKLGADSSAVDRRIAEIRRELASLSSKRIGIDVDARTAQAKVDRLSAELNRLGRQSPNIQVRADTAAASAALTGVSALAGRLDGRNVAITVDAAGVSRAISLLGLLTAGLASVAAMAGPAVAGMLAIGPAVGSAAQGIGALAAGFSGVGDAVKALSDAETKAAAGTAVSAAQRTNSAQAIAGAQRAVQRATERADRAAVQGAQQVQDARRALGDAYADAARRVEAAEQNVTRAQRTARQAQEDLTRARAEAREEIEDLGRSLRGAALDEREAELRLAEAREALASGRTGGVQGRDLQRLELDAERAALALEEARDRHQDLQQESAQAARAGVEGSDRVVAAQQRAADAAQGVRDAEAELARARADGARQVADAQRQVQRAVQQSAWAQQDAAAAITDAQTALANTYQDTGNLGATSLNKVKEAMEGLSPEAQRFARFLVGEVIPGLHKIRDAVQASLLPRMETALREIGKLTPVVASGLAETGRVIGDLSVKGARMMASGPWQSDFATIMASNNRSLASFGNAGLSVADAFRSITVASLPLTERFARFLEQSAQAFDSFIIGARATGELDRWFAQMSDTLAELGRILGQIITGLFDLSQALGPLGMILLRTVGTLVEFLGQLAQINHTITQVAASVLIGVAAFNAIGKAVAGATLAAGVAAGGWKTLLDTFGKLAPSALAATGPMQKVATGLNAAELAAGRYTDRLFTSTAAAERAATTGARLGTTVTRIASALPVAGLAVAGFALAWDGLTISADEAAEALVAGGAKAAEATRKLQEQDARVEQLRSRWLLFVPVAGAVANLLSRFVASSDDAAEAAQRLRDKMTPLQLAQAGATDAAYRYGQAVKQHGPTSWQAATAAGALASATDLVEQEQRQAEEATQSWTDKLIEQRDTMLGSIDAEIRYEAAVDSLTESIAANGTTLDLNTASGRANMTALQEVAKAAIGHLQAMADQGAGIDQITAKERAYRDTLFRTAMQAGMTRAEARRYVDQLHLIPPNISTRIHADTGPAFRAIEGFLNAAQGREIVMRVRADTSNITTLGTPVRRAGSIDYRPMQSGGFRSMNSGLAAVVPARTPTLIGDHPRVPESYIPWDRSPRSHRILDVTNAAMGRRVLPMAAGGALSRGGAGSGDVFAPLAESADDLTKLGLRPLADELTKTTVPTLETLQRHAERDTPDAIRSLTGVTQASTTSMDRAWTHLGSRLTGVTAGMTRDMTSWQRVSNTSWRDIQTRAGGAVGHMTGPVFGGLHRGMDAVAGHAGRMAGAVGGQFGRIRGLTADPIRWSLHNPINRGLVGAWNSIDRFFALGRPMGPVPVGFQAGGTVPGTGSGDKVPTMLESGEEVIRKDIAGPTRRFLKALNAGQAEAIQAAGGRFARFQMGGTVERTQQFARQHHGKPYVWASAGPGGFDCSGFMSALIRYARGESDPYRRIGSTGTMPWPGLTPGLTSAFGLGWFTGNPGHMAGTVGGMNVESGGSPSMTKAGAGAAGATHPQFRGHASLPQIGGRFIPGGPGGFDVEGYLRKEFAATRRMIAEIRPRFGPGNPPTAMTRLGGDAVGGAHRSATAFDGGGLARGSGWLYKRAVRPERVLSPQSTEAFDRLVEALATKRGLVPLVLSAAQRSAATGAASTIDQRAIVASIEQAVRRFAERVTLDGATLRLVDDGRNGLARIVRRQERSLVRQG